MEHDGEDVTGDLKAYAAAVRASPHNLLSRAGLEELESRHIPESVRFARRIPNCRSLLDVGSGGGLPGIVIAIVRPEIEVHFLEATTKKAEFLTGVSQDLGLRVIVHNGRAEALAQSELRGAFEVVTARAVARLSRLIPLCAPYLTPEGLLLAIKGDRWADEVTESESVMRRLGMRVVTSPADRPDDDPRVVVIGHARS